MWHKNLPSLDLHGETRESTRFLVKEFLTDHYKMGNERVIIIHGIGKGLLRKEVHELLKRDSRVVKFQLDYFNSGCTVVEMSIFIDRKSKKCYNTQQVIKGGGH